MRLQDSVVVVLNVFRCAHLVLRRGGLASNRLLERNEMGRDLPAHFVRVLVGGVLALCVLRVRPILCWLLGSRCTRPVLGDFDLALGEFDVLLLYE